IRDCRDLTFREHRSLILPTTLSRTSRVPREPQSLWLVVSAASFVMESATAAFSDLGLGHQRENVSLGIFEIRKPYFTIREFRNQVRIAAELHPGARESGVRGLDVFDGEIEDRALVIKLRFGRAEHQPHAIAVK